jgi:hypothetical protein
MVMTIVNAVANAVVGSYPQVIVLPRTGFAGEPLNGEDEQDQYVNGEEEMPKGIRLLAARDEEELIEWIQGSHPYLTIYPPSLRRDVFLVVSAVLLIALVTLIMGLLTRFRLGIASRAAWFLVWLYVSPFGMMLASPVLLMRKVSLTILSLAVIASIPLSIGGLISAIGGLAVVSVGLLESMCQSTWVIPLRIWVAIGSVFFGLSTLGSLLLSFLVSFLLSTVLNIRESVAIRRLEIKFFSLLFFAVSLTTILFKT